MQIEPVVFKIGLPRPEASIVGLVELYLFRHGRTIWNAQGRYQGHADVDLDELGQKQALAVAQRCREIHPIALYSSDLRRCFDVASRIAEATDLPIASDVRLRERDVGVWSGLTRREIAERFPDDFARWRDGDETVRPGGGESVEDMQSRIGPFVDEVSEHANGPVIGVTHAGWIRSMVEWCMGNAFPRRSLGVPSQGSLTVFSIEDGNVTLEAFNDRGHLLSVEDVDQEPPAPRIY